MKLSERFLLGVIENEKVLFEKWLADEIRERIQDAMVDGRLSPTESNQILKEMIKETRDRINFTILEERINISARRIMQLIKDSQNIVGNQ